MSLVVQKYGGSSVSDLDKIGGVADRIQRTLAKGHRVVAVVSAMGNTTSELLALARQVSQTPDRRELDMLVSVGERISMALLAMCLRDRGVPARSLTGSQSGIITDEAHAGARVVAVRPDRVQACLDDGEVVIVAGFQGVSRGREVTTLGRGGSDTTAVVLAAALQADWCELCSDVDGVWSADPRVVSDAHKLDTLGLDQALTLTRGGAKVLHEAAVRYARDRGIALRAVSTFGPGSGTRLQVDPEGVGSSVAVTSDTQLLSVSRGGASRASLTAAVVAGGGLLRRRVGDRLWVDTRNAHGTWSWPAGVGPVRATASVTAVGSGLGEDPEAFVRAEAALEGLAVGTSGSEGDALWWEVAPAEAHEAVRAVHRALVTQGRGPGG